MKSTGKNSHQLASTNHDNVNSHLILDFHENASQGVVGIFHLLVH